MSYSELIETIIKNIEDDIEKNEARENISWIMGMQNAADIVRRYDETAKIFHQE